MLVFDCIAFWMLLGSLQKVPLREGFFQSFEFGRFGPPSLPDQKNIQNQALVLEIRKRGII